MSPHRPLLWIFLAAGCDASYGNFLDAVPVEESHSGEPTLVYLAVDGLSRAAFDGARARGAFSTMKDADLITFFPAISDYSWTRMLRAGPLPSYELQYFDPAANLLRNQGLRGVIEHPIKQGILDPLPVYRRFDFLGDGVLWSAKGYSDAEAALPSTLDAMFDLFASRGRREKVLTAYLMNVDVVSHRGGLDRAITMLVEIDRRLTEFQQRHPGRFLFTLISDHGNAHRAATLVDPRDILRNVDVRPAESLTQGPTADLHAVPIVHVRVNAVIVHTRPEQALEVARRASTHRHVDLAAARSDTGFAVFHRGAALEFFRGPTGDIFVPRAEIWRAIGIDLADFTDPVSGAATLTDHAAFEITRTGPYPDIFYRVASAFLHPVVCVPASVILSLPDDVTSFGFHVPGSGDSQAVDGFHGALSRGSALSVVASQVHDLPPAVRADDLMDLFPALAQRVAALGH